jgi:thioredoxin-dependent peroxiredoxin
MKIQTNQTAPIFTTRDVNGDTVNLSDLKGQKILLTFYRNVGCPVCNQRFHELQGEADYFKSKGLLVLSIYESSPENMKKYLEGESFYSIMIPNPDLSLYTMYNIEKSGGKLMKGMFHGAIHKMELGKKLFQTKIKQDGNANRISADFLIDENGKVLAAYYGKYLGDHLPMSDIKKLIN